MGKAASAAVNAGGWFAWVLDFCGWVILLSGVSAMQKVGPMRCFSKGSLEAPVHPMQHSRSGSKTFHIL